MKKRAKVKYSPVLRIQVVKEYFQGASAKELYAKYGIKDRTIYDWSRKAKDGTLVSETEKKTIDFLDCNVVNDIIIVNDKEKEGLENRIKELEEQVKTLSCVFNLIIDKTNL